MEVSETVCKENFEEYAQATWKKSGKPTIIRLQTHTGNMNPDMSKVDIVPDEDLNKALKFHVSRRFICASLKYVLTHQSMAACKSSLHPH